MAGISKSDGGRISVIGIVLCLLAAVCCAAGVVCQKLALRHASAVQVTSSDCFTGTTTKLLSTSGLFRYLRRCAAGPRHPLHISSASRLKQRHRRSRRFRSAGIPVSYGSGGNVSCPGRRAAELAGMDITGRLAGKVPLVTGGSWGIGAEITRRLAAEGADVEFTYLSGKSGLIRSPGWSGAWGGGRSRSARIWPSRARRVRSWTRWRASPGGGTSWSAMRESRTDGGAEGGGSVVRSRVDRGAGRHRGGSGVSRLGGGGFITGQVIYAVGGQHGPVRWNG